MYRLKKGREAFQIVDGPDAGKTYRPGMGYDQAPKGYENWFENIKPEKAPAPKPPKPVVKPDIVKPNLEGDKE
jgi:hypothetical protein